MDMCIEEISSDTLISNFDNHIKISAGPGAGKTTWLINHIKNVLGKSKKLKTVRKIACITYTNVAVETIIKRLEFSLNNVEVSTIHAFLYKNILKPYAIFLPDEFRVAYREIKGHDDTILSGYKFLEEWKTRTGQQRIQDNEVVVEAFSQLRWTFDKDCELIVNTPYPIRVEGYSIKKASYFEYKKMAWEKGVIHHDDVLFLSYQLIVRNRFLLNVITAKFPYFFIDEFQDINPIQLKILNLLIETGTCVCAIGDYAQSIYGFMGAEPRQFLEFKPTGIREYVINDNWRSTKKIIAVLNHIRTDIRQKCKREIIGDLPTIIVGDVFEALIKVHELSKSSDICTLTYYNIIANGIRKHNLIYESEDALTDLICIDRNGERRRAVEKCIRAIEYAEQGYYKDSLKQLSSFFPNKNENIIIKRSLEALKKLIYFKSEYENSTLSVFLLIIQNCCSLSLSKLGKGKIKEFYDSTTYSKLAVWINSVNESLPYRTIHKSKGDEFDCVLIVLAGKNGLFEESKELSFLIEPNISKEEHRLNYVAMSRAVNSLYINVPHLSFNNEDYIKAKDLEIMRL